MWAAWFHRPAQDEKLVETTRSLLEDTLERLIYGSIAILFVWFFITGQSSADLLMWKFWLVFFFTFGVVRLATYLISRRPLAAGLAWFSGLFIINCLFVFLLRRPEAIFFYALLPLQAVIVLGWAAGAGMLAGIGLALLAVSRFSGLEYPAAYLLVVFISGLVSALLGWISSGSMIGEVKNSVYFSRLAQRNLEEAREHRGQMFKLLKDLDLAYYRLERANAALVAAWKEAETAEKFKAEFVTYVSHEMRTPLNLILGFSEAVLTSPESYGNQLLPGPYRADINKINQNANHLLALVEDVIDLSRANVNRIPLTREKVDIKGLVNEAVEMVRDYIETKGLKLQVDQDERLDILVIDRLRIRQVLLNLLVNAARFTSSGRIEVAVRLEADVIRFKVRDTGKGISPAEIDRIFEEYHTSGGQDPAWHSGSGLGLPISKKLVELHGGEMGVESIPQQGTVFWFTLPIEYETEMTPGQSLPAAFSALPYQPPSSERIVVLEHTDPGAGRIFRRMTRGLQVQQAGPRGEALELARELHALALVSPAESSRDLPAGMVQVEFPLPGAGQIAAQLGVAEVLEKPVLQNDLLEVIERVAPGAGDILVVDDENEITELFQRILNARCGENSCRAASSGLEMLGMVRERRPDLIILDLVMPEMDGYEVIRTLRADAQTAGIPIVVISGTVGDIYEARVEAPLCLRRQGGFKLGEAIQVIEAVVNALSPGWS